LSSTNLRIMLADDHAVVRSGLRRMLEQRQGFIVVAEANSGELAYQAFGAHNPDVVIMDLTMPGMGGMEAMRRILSRNPGARMLVFSMHDNASFAAQALKAGARGYVTKQSITEDLFKAVQEVARGNIYLSSDMAQKIALHSLTGEDDPMKELSAREFEIFRSIAEGFSVEEIAEKLKISQKTVANYQTMIKQKLGATSSVDLIKLAIRHGVIES
jgi:two-component system, NarL family, invasion response regulator UvrY